MKKIWLVILLCVALGMESRWYYEESIMTVKSEEEGLLYETDSADGGTQEKDYIKWVEFNVTCEAMDKAYEYDLDTYTKEIHLWIF